MTARISDKQMKEAHQFAKNFGQHVVIWGTQDDILYCQKCGELFFDPSNSNWYRGWRPDWEKCSNKRESKL